jgi:predicted nucleotidyltransferase
LKLAKSVQDDIAVILEEEAENIEKLIREYPNLMDIFTLKIDLFL